MTRYLLKRLFWMIPLLIGISLISFFIMHLAPGDITTT
ncbi:MAG: diguanylate cyclase, partial [Methylobacillus sp.]|nr:diguanylate cyclase [Methylobacillus sp.]